MNVADIRLFSADLDGTLLGNAESTWRFAQAWFSLPLGTRPLLVYNTGRTVADTQQVVAARGLPDPDYIIGSLGTELHAGLYKYADEFRSQFGSGWDLETVDRIVGAIPGVRRQPGEFLHHHKSSWYWVRARNNDVDDLRRRLRNADIRASVIYSCRYFLDVIPAGAGKGKALAWLCDRLGISLDRVLVAGDSGNDSEMFLLPGVNGLLVENALPELHAAAPKSRIYLARTPMADGVIEGLQHFGVVRGAPTATGASRTASFGGAS